MSNSIDGHFCLRTPYATAELARQKIAQIARGRARAKHYATSTRTYHERLCQCGMYHITSRNGKG